MTGANVKETLIDIAHRLPETASFEDAMYELYVRMKVMQGRQAAEEGRVTPHEEVERRFAK